MAAAAGFRVSPFRKLLNKIADNLTDRDMTTLKFLCGDKIPKSVLGGIPDGKAMFAELLSRRVILEGDLTALEDLLLECNREDLVYLLEEFREENSVDRGRAPPGGEQQAAGMPPRRDGTAPVNGSMSELHRAVLRDHHAVLVRDMHTRHVLPHLLATGVLTDRLEAEIINTGGSRQAMNEALLQVLPTRGDQAFRQFCTALRTGSQQDYLATALEQAENMARGLDRRPQPLVMTDSEGPAYPHTDFSLQEATSYHTASILLFKFNPHTAHHDIRLSHNNTTIHRETIKNERKETPSGWDRFVDTRFLPNPTVLGNVSVSSGVYYWEVNVRSSLTYRIGVAYENAPRHVCLGDSNASWCLVHSPMERSGRHNGKSFPLEIPSPERLGVLLDYRGGRLSFCDVDRRRILHTFLAHFSQPLYPAFSVWDGELSLVSISHVPRFL